MMKRGVASAVARRAWDYLRYDFREIVWPRPMPDPPGKFPQISSMSPGEHLKCWRDGIGSYLDGWRWYNGEPKKERHKQCEEAPASSLLSVEGSFPRFAFLDRP